MDKVDERAVKSRFQHLQKGFCDKKRKALANASEMFTFAIELFVTPDVNALNAIDSDVANASVTMVDALKRALEVTKNAKMLFAKITKAPEGIKEAHNYEGYRYREKRDKEIVARKAAVFESQKIFEL